MRNLDQLAVYCGSAPGSDPAFADAARETAAAMVRLLDDPALANRLGTAAHARVQDHFLGDRHLSQYVELFARLST